MGDGPKNTAFNYVFFDYVFWVIGMSKRHAMNDLPDADLVMGRLHLWCIGDWEARTLTSPGCGA